MDVLFYDRKNNCEVRASQLVEIRLHNCVLSADDDEAEYSGRRIHPVTGENIPESLLKDDFLDEYPGWESWAKEKVAKYIHVGSQQIARLGYKSPACDKVYNWDRWCNDADLVFLRVLGEDDK